MRKTILSLLIGCICNFTWGQDTSTDTKALINKIKKSQSYLSAEATMPSEEDAFKLANELLVQEINEWVMSKRKSETIKQVILQDISSCASTMDMKRGTNVRAFVFVKKKDIIPIYGNGQILLSEHEEGVDIQPLSDISEPLKMDKNTSLDQKAQPANDPIKNMERIIAASSMSEMKIIFAELKERDAITYGTFKTNEAPEVCFLIFYNKSGEIQAVVRKVEDMWKDLKSDISVKPADFNGCGAYWFLLN